MKYLLPQYTWHKCTFPNIIPHLIYNSSFINSTQAVVMPLNNPILNWIKPCTIILKLFHNLHCLALKRTLNKLTWTEIQQKFTVVSSEKNYFPSSMLVLLAEAEPEGFCRVTEVQLALRAPLQQCTPNNPPFSHWTSPLNTHKAGTNWNWFLLK